MGQKVEGGRVNTFRPSSVAILGNKDLLRNPQCAVRARSRHAVFWQTSTQTDNAPRGCAPIQPSTVRLGYQTRCVCASPAWLEAPQDPFLDRSSRAAWWALWLDSCLVIKMPVTFKVSSRDGITPSLPHMRHSVGNRRMRPDRETLKSAQKPEKIDGETW